MWASNTHNPPLTNNEMFDALDDVIGEQNTYDENVNEYGDGLDTEFDALFKELNTELYPSNNWMSSLNFLAKLMHIKVINKWTDSSFDQLLEFLRVSFPKENKIPASYYEAKKKLRNIGLGYQSIHACINDCALFWKENSLMQNCHVCNESRCVDKNIKGKKVAQKVLRYFPLTSRLRRRFSSRFTAKDMIWHNIGRSTDGMMRHPVDGKAWQEFDNRYPNFSKEPRNIRLGLAVDGFNPFGNMSQTYSMWPMVLTTYNTPPWLCMKESSFMLTLLIPGPKSPGKDIDVFLRPLVDELKTLCTDGVQMRDAHTKTIFTMRAALLWTINDYPARSSLFGWSGQGLPIHVSGKHPSHGGVKRKRAASELNWSKKSIFFELDYWSSLLLKHNLDVMHVEKNVCESLLGTSLMNEKSKDTPKARQDLEKMGIRKNLWLTKNNKFYQPHAPYSFTPTYRERFCKFIRGTCVNQYKDRKTKLKKHFDKERGHDNTERAKQNPPKGIDPEAWVQVKEGGVPQHVEGWRDMHFKESS
ncbi:hypothetical protein E3N88_39152 [Mikania micrantha]|uniref:Transposase-associated domain-containing protein n=1 Tax=Mikania micrantha TaxID=192012 RepID=A0A5N6LWT4_9ASTR|nr:hypothetical protein E3N88_39152 [Mikania micrantha]